MKFPRFGCVFCTAHSELRSTHNIHLDSLIKEVTNARSIAPALRKGQHFLPVIRAVRRRSGRNKKQRPIAIKTSEYDCCDKWRLYVMINNVAELQDFETRILPSVAEWTSIADAFVAHRAERTQRRLNYDNSDEETDTDIEDGYIPTLPSQGPVVPATSAPARPDPRSTASARPKSLRRARYTIDSDSDPAEHPALITTQQHRRHKHGANTATGAFATPAQNSMSLDIAGDMHNQNILGSRSRRRMLSPMSLLTPPPPPARARSLYDFDLPTPVKPDITLRVREVGRVVLPAGTTLATAVKEVARRVGEALGPDAGAVCGLRDAQGLVAQRKWERKTRDGEEWMVGVEWDW